MRVMKHRKGQFIILAVLMIAVMMVSLGAVLYSAVTYYKRERWEEYLGIIDHVKIGCYRLAEISLANYTLTNNTNILRDNFIRWQSDLKKVYPGFGIILNYSLTEGLHYVYGENIMYNLGLASRWHSNSSFSAANVTFTMNITSVGLTGYKFKASAFLQVKLLEAVYVDSKKKTWTILLTVDREELMPVTNLQKASFSVSLNNQSKDFSFSRYYNSTYSSFVYQLLCSNTQSPPTSTMVNVTDSRGIKVVASYPPT